MDKNELLKDLHIDLNGNTLVIAYKGTTLGSVQVDWDAVLNGASARPKPKQENVKQYVEGCDLGWC
ncbi:hypothetical protein CathTA2_0236 [Caldalkalibacillus thermarum TA2.A1]|uniref:Uncharacterized protein n=1 Tax=Caldalkalibacillus thermarum (strain TA2.A1) TaxID=986075 RepID=F5L374_CALTT|nr:hypothetical protein [Caldalkalibacillus thermarum]EGL84206.1 hypothetical protein CathTA2_0236 [Caldalkalibacillus thermarum TA2.A1]QZT35076.1 hypothetical protein HUR95_07590 [Caldalkalibacillus thermarum TA2.A1]